MEYEQIMQALRDYGAVAIVCIVFLEYMNLPGFPAGVIMPLAGLWASHGEMHFITVLLLSTLAGLAGSWVLYLLGYIIGRPLLEKWTDRFPAQREPVKRALKFVHERGYTGLLIGKLIPVLRTLISIPAGVIRMDFIGYTLFSSVGILLWNLVFIGAGYYFGEWVLPLILH